MTKKQATAENQTEKAGALPLFYANPTPIDSSRHGKLGLKKNFGLEFAAKVNAVPVNMIEMPQVCHFYPIAFSPDEHATPVALLGLRDNENLFVDARGEWEEGAYIPAYIRRYPFIFSEIPGNDKLTLCVDMNPGVVSEKGEQKLFESDGKPSALAQNALEFCKSYHAAARQSQEFSRALAASGILVDRQAEIGIAQGKRINFSGFRVVDENKLNEMSDAQFLDWRKRGWLPFLYAHLFSGAQWQRLSFLLRKRMASEGGGDAQPGGKKKGK